MLVEKSFAKAIAMPLDSGKYAVVVLTSMPHSAVLLGLSRGKLWAHGRIPLVSVKTAPTVAHDS